MNKKLLISGVVAASAFMLSSGANAALSVWVSDGTNSTTISEDATGRVNYFDDLLVFDSSALFADWGITINANGNAFYDVLNPGANYDHMHYNSVDVSGGGAGGTLTIMFTETDLMKGGTRFSADYSATLGGTSIQFESYTDAGNAAFALTNSVADSGVQTSSFANTEGGNVPLTGPYSWTTVATIIHGGPGDTTSFDYDVKIPEPSTVALLGLGLLGLGFAARRKGKKEASGVAA